jgi:subfamily B ATP-binding cassette protein MsbA
MAADLSLGEKARALYLIAAYRPRFTAGIIVFSLFTALFEGIGVTFIVPLVEVASSPGVPEDGIGGLFADAYGFIGVPFTLGYIVAGLAGVLVVRYIATFLAEWARINLRIGYVSDLQTRGFENALAARVAYFDSEGSDDILNAIITQASKAGQAIEGFVHVFRFGVLILMYLGIAMYLAPLLTLVSGALVVCSTFLLRTVVESGYAVGDRVADANERIQVVVQAGTQGIREVKMIQYADNLLEEFGEGMTQFVNSSVRVKRNEALIGNAQDLFVALIVFVLIYAALTFTSMTFGALGAFLFVMFKLGPIVSNVNQRYYQIEGLLPHLVRTEEFIDELRSYRDIDGGDTPVPEPPTPVRFDDVTFGYDQSDPVLDDVSLRVEEGEFVALVGESGAGKSTVASLLARLYVQDSGTITAAGTPIEEYDISAWRSRIAYVRQDPFIFNTTLRRNLVMANPDASRQELERVAEIAQVTEFLSELPDGYDTELGDNGVRLSGGQRQRVALARALLQDADLLVLDEATSDLDTRIERTVQSAIETMDREFTIIAIAHRLSTVRSADRIYTLDDGEIVESGEHESLLEEDGQYADLYQPQGAPQ